MRVQKSWLVIIFSSIIPLSVITYMIVSNSTVWNISALVIVVCMQIALVVSMLLEARVKNWGDSEEEILKRGKKYLRILIIESSIIFVVFIVAFILQITL